MAKLMADRRHEVTQRRKEVLLHLIEQGMSVLEALPDPRVGVSYSAYRKWKQTDKAWAAKVNIARATSERIVAHSEMSSAQFALRYFGRVRAPFQQQWIDAVENLRPGNILMALWPPEHGKTTTFEDYATEKICRVPEWRNTTASEADTISKRIVSRVRNRLEVNGPFPLLVKEWGPFRSDAGASRENMYRQPWNNAHFRVMKKQASDERDHSMLAIGWNSSTVSIRTDHLHVDDIQSLKTLGRTDTQLEWFRQDALSRPGETGVTSIAGTRVGDNDFYEALLEDEELEGILEVIKFPAIIYGPDGSERPLWPEMFTLDGLDRIRRKVKDDAFDRNYMMSPGASKTKRTFSDEGKARALSRVHKLNEWQFNSQLKPPVYLSLDPGLDPGKCNLDVWLPSAETMRLVGSWESDRLLRNEEIMEMISTALQLLTPHYKPTVLTIEAANFQRGLARDDRLKALKDRYGFRIREHNTNDNKYDANIGIASMAGDWEAGKIILPYFDEKKTRVPIDELCRQLKAWKPLVRGSKLRQDRVMTMWFAWIVWQEQKGRLVDKPQSWRRQGVPYEALRAQPIIPIGAKL
jgi:hypothetical protein